MPRLITALTFLACLAAGSAAQAQREVHWQIEPNGFPDNTSVFVDVQEGSVFRRDLPITAFALSMDEYAGDQGGYIMNGNQQFSGQAGAAVLIMIDRSRSYTGEFDRARQFAKKIAEKMDVAKDRVAVAAFPTDSGYAAARLMAPFTNNIPSLKSAIDQIGLPPSDDETGARFCDAMNEGLKFFDANPAETKNKYRVIIFLTGGADKAEGKGDCVQQSYAAGKVPYYNVGFALDRKYDDKRNSHKIENGLYDIAQKTGGQSCFRRSDNEINQFIAMFWNRIRSQYQLQTSFPCFTPAPMIEHTSMLKVEGRDTEAIRFQATSAQAPVPAVAALYPPQAPKELIEDGKVELTVDGSGFCGGAAQLRVTVNGAPVQVKSASPFRLVATLNSTVTDSGTVKVTNRFGQTGESAAQFVVDKVKKGGGSWSWIVGLVLVIVFAVAAAVVVVAIKGRRAKVAAKAPAPAAAPAPAPAPAPAQRTSNAPRTVALSQVSGVFVLRADGSRAELVPGQNLIGREPHCKIKLEVPGVSREHARVELDAQAGQVWITDLGSTNGTYLGPAAAGQTGAARLTARTQWTAGDAVWIGGEKLALAFESGSREG